MGKGFERSEGSAVKVGKPSSVLVPFTPTPFFFLSRPSPARLMASCHLYTDDHRFIA